MFAENFSRSKLCIAASLVILGVLGRFFLIKFVGLPNLEIVTALTLVSAVFLGGSWSFIVPLSIISLTDVVIGNGPVLFFTWTAFAIIGIFGFLYKKFIIRNSRFMIHNSLRYTAKRLFEVAGLGIGSALFFYLYTNFGWWLVSGMYPHTLDGLIRCYVMGLPFFKNNLIGNLIFVPGLFAVAGNISLRLSCFSGGLNLEKELSANRHL